MTFHRTVIGGAEIDDDVRANLDREADALQVTFYVDKHQEDEREEDSLRFAMDAPELAKDAVKRLREFAIGNGVNIYVHKADYSDVSFENAVITGRSTKR